MRTGVSIVILSGICILQAANPDNMRFLENSSMSGTRSVNGKDDQVIHQSETSLSGFSLFESFKNGAATCFRPCLGCICEPKPVDPARTDRVPDLELQPVAANPLRHPDAWVYTTMPPRQPGTEGLRFRRRITETDALTQIVGHPPDSSGGQQPQLIPGFPPTSTPMPQPDDATITTRGTSPDTSTLRSKHVPKQPIIGMNPGFEMGDNLISDGFIDLADDRELTEDGRDSDEDRGFILV